MVFLASVTVMWLAIAEDSNHIQASSPKKVASLSYTDEFGKTATISPTNKLTIVHFWATWCEPCIEEMPELEKLQKRYAKDGVRVYALSMDGKNISKVQQFMESHNISALRPMLDSEMKSFKAVMGTGLPTSIFINGNGRQIARAEGPLNWQSMEVSEFVEKATR